MTFLEDMTLIISILLAFFLAAVLIKEYFEKRIRLLWLLISSIILGAIDRVIAFIFQRGTTSIDLLIIAFFTFIVSLYMMYLFFDLFENPTPTLRPMMIYTFFLGFNVAFISSTFTLLPFLGQSLDFNSTIFNEPPASLTSTEFLFLRSLLLGSIVLFTLGVVIYSLIIPSHVLLILNRIRRRFHQSDIQRPYLYMLVGFIIYLIGAHLGFIGIIARVLEILGQGLILYVFIRNKSVIISAHRLDNLIIINDSGLVLLNYSFPTTKVQVDELLLSGILSALTSSMREIVQSGEHVQSIQLGDLHLTIRTLTGNAHVILISERVSRFILDAIDQFVREFEQQFKTELVQTRDGLVQPNTFEMAKKIVERIFLIKGTASPGIK